MIFYGFLIEVTIHNGYLVEIEKPQGTLFNQNKSVSNYLKKGIEQVDNWRRYFAEYPSEKERIFKAKNLKFRYILIIGNKEEWEKTEFSKIGVHIMTKR